MVLFLNRIQFLGVRVVFGIFTSFCAFSFFLFFFFFFCFFVFLFCFEVILSHVRCEIKLRLFPAMTCLFLVSRIRLSKCLLLLFF